MRLLILIVTLLFVSAPASAQSTTAAATVPSEHSLTAAYPNPFSTSTRFALTVERRQRVRVEVYNLLGQPIQLVYDGVVDAGERRAFEVDGSALPNGVFLYRVDGEHFTETRQMTLIR